MQAAAQVVVEAVVAAARLLRLQTIGSAAWLVLPGPLQLPVVQTQWRV